MERPSQTEMRSMLDKHSSMAIGKLLINNWKNSWREIDIFNLYKILTDEILEVRDEIYNISGTPKGLIEWKHLLEEALDARNACDFIIDHCLEQLQSQVELKKPIDIDQFIK